MPEEEKYSVKSEEPFLIKFTTRKNFFQEMNSLRRTVLFKPPELDKDVVWVQCLYLLGIKNTASTISNSQN